MVDITNVDEFAAAVSGFAIDNGFTSAQILTVGAAQIAIWTIATTPPRTAGKGTNVYWIWVYNISGVTRNFWLENLAGLALCPPCPVETNQAVLVRVPTPIKIGDIDLYFRASGNNVYAVIGGIEA